MQINSPAREFFLPKRDAKKISATLATHCYGGIIALRTPEKFGRIVQDKKTALT